MGEGVIWQFDTHTPPLINKNKYIFAFLYLYLLDQLHYYFNNISLIFGVVIMLLFFLGGKGKGGVKGLNIVNPPPIIIIYKVLFAIYFLGA